MRSHSHLDFFSTKTLAPATLSEASVVSSLSPHTSLATSAKDQNSCEIPRAGFKVIPWCKAAGFSRATLYKLPPELMPKTLKLGRRRIIYETPQDYLRRIAEKADEAA